MWKIFFTYKDKSRCTVQGKGTITPELAVKCYYRYGLYAAESIYQQYPKTLKGCIAAILTWSFKNQQTVDKDIIKAAGVSASKVTLGIPGMARAKKIITDYYMGK